MDETFTFITGSYVMGTIPISGNIYEIEITRETVTTPDRLRFSFLS